MEIKKEKIEDQNYLIKIEVNKEDYQDKVENKLKEYKRKVAIKGFRPGKVPIGMVKQMYGPQVTAEEIDHLLHHALDDFLKKENIELIGDPIVQEDSFKGVDFTNPGNFEVSYEIGTAPDVSINYNGQKLPKYNIKIDDELLHENLDKLREQRGKLEKSDTITEKSYIEADIQELNEEGEIKQDGIANSKFMPVNSIKDEATRKKVLKLKIGESIDVDLFKAFNDDIEQIGAHLLNISAEETEQQKEKQFRITVRDIKDVKKAELNQEFFDAILGPGTVKSEEEFLEKYREILSKSYENVSRDKLFQDVVKKLEEKTDLPLPDGFLKKWLNKNKKEGVTDKEIEEYYENHAKYLKQNLLLNKLLKDNNIEIDAKEIDAYVENYMRSSFGLPADMDLNEEPFGDYKKNLINNKEFINNAIDAVRKEKLTQLFEEKFEFEDKEISFNEFLELNNQQEKTTA